MRLIAILLNLYLSFPSFEISIKDENADIINVHLLIDYCENY